MERLTKLYSGKDKEFEGRYICNYNKNCNDSCLYNACKWREEATQKLAEYENAEEQGLLVRLPIAIGSVIYKIVYRLDDFSGYDYPVVVQDSFRIDMFNQIGKFVFLTKAEALQALKERE